MSEIASKRIALTPTTFDQLRDFSRGLGMQYDDAIQVLLGMAAHPGEDMLIAGRRLRSGLRSAPTPQSGAPKSTGKAKDQKPPTPESIEDEDDPENEVEYAPLMESA
jgi:hypothetical protein